VAYQVKCPHCSVVHKAPPEAAGKRVTCKSCHKDFIAPKPRSKSSPPPVQSADRPWSIHQGGQTLGPFSLRTVIEEIQAGKFDETTLAWKDGMSDWKPLGEIEAFQDALSAAGMKPASGAAAARGGTSAARLPAARRGTRPSRTAPDDEGSERRRRYSRGKSKRDVYIGAWVAAGLAAITLVVILIVTNKPTPVEEPEAPAQPRSAAPASPQGQPTAPTAKHGPRPARKRTPRRVPAEQRLTRVVADLEKRFPKIIAAHKKGDAKPIGSFIRYLRIHADALAKYDWGPHQERMTRFIAQLREAAQGIEATLKDKPWVGGVLGEGLSQEQRAEALRLNETDWLENWVRILRLEIETLREKGVRF
jgi:hypothetical protein